MFFIEAIRKGSNSILQSDMSPNYVYTLIIHHVFPHYQEKVQRFLNEVRRGNKDYNMMIQNNKEFRNPGIYEKLIDLLQLDEMGTNYPLVR